jgi:cystathionine beta-synthase/cysteine synthase A
MHTLDEILADRVVRALNPEGKQFLKAHPLSSRLNPFPIEISALTVEGFPNLKSVPAFEMLMGDYRAGVYEGKDTLVVPSSGNTAYAVARLAPAFGFRRVIVILSTDVPPLKRGILAALSSVMIVETPRNTMDEAHEIANSFGPGVHLLDQYSHESNRRSHERYTGPEVLRAMGGSVDLVMIALGSAGTAMGIASYLKKQNPQTRVLGSQPAVGEQAPGTRDPKKIDAVVPFDWRGAIDGVVLGTRKGSFIRMRELWSEVEPIQGPSAGLSLDCLLRYLAGLPEDERAALKGKKAAIICHDGGLLYPDYTTGELDTHEGMSS